MKKIFNKRNINELGIRAYDKKNTILHDLQFHDFMCKHTLKFSINCTSTASYTHIIAFGELNFYSNIYVMCIDCVVKCKMYSTFKQNKDHHCIDMAIIVRIIYCMRILYT